MSGWTICRCPQRWEPPKSRCIPEFASELRRRRSRFGRGPAAPRGVGCELHRVPEAFVGSPGAAVHLSRRGWSGGLVGAPRAMLAPSKFGVARLARDEDLALARGLTARDDDAVAEVREWIAKASSSFRRRLDFEWDDLQQELLIEVLEDLRSWPIYRLWLSARLRLAKRGS